MKFSARPEVLLQHIDMTTREVAEDILGRVRATTPRHTGHLADSYHVVEVESGSGHIVLGITSDVEYAAAIERGAWLRGRRGPHISGSGKGRHTLRNMGRTFGRRMSAKLKRIGADAGA